MCHYSNLKLPSSLSLILVMWLVSAFRMPELHEARQSHAQFWRDHNGSQHPHCTVPLVQSQSRFEGLHPVALKHSTWLGHPSAVHSKPFASYEQSTPLWLSPALAKSTCTCRKSYHKFVFRKSIIKTIPNVACALDLRGKGKWLAFKSFVRVLCCQSHTFPGCTKFRKSCFASPWRQYFKSWATAA